MDLDEIDSPSEYTDAKDNWTRHGRRLSASKALQALDQHWYTRVSRQCRWMDLIGDYAGDEKFVLDGDALLHNILDDPLLAIGRPGDLSFQLLHAKFNVEKLLENLLKRSAVFEIVFWHENRHQTLCTGSTAYTLASRALARRLLFTHLSEVEIPVHTFQDLFDPGWIAYVRNERPMFVMTNDGGILNSADGMKAERILIQRMFVHDVLSSGLSVSFMSSADFHNTKIMSFVCEQRRMPNARGRIPGVILDALELATAKLQGLEASYRLFLPTPLSRIVLDGPSVLGLDPFLKRLCESYLNDSKARGDATPFPYLKAFVAHVILLDDIPIAQRAQRPVALDAAMTEYLDSFIPTLFVCLERLVGETGRNLDIDLRIFATLLKSLTHYSSMSFKDVVGCNVQKRTDAIWSSLPVPSVTFEVFASFSALVEPTFDPEPLMTLRVLPFDNPILNAHLATVHVEAEEARSEKVSVGHWEFGDGTSFSDTRHWHNKRALLPKHLGGEDAKPQDSRTRNKQLKGNQLFMASLQRQATTLTGALGAPLQQQVIVSAPSSSRTSTTKDQIKPQRPKETKKGKGNTHVSSADKIRQQIQAEKRSKDDDESSLWWRNQLKDLEGISPALERAVKLEALFRNKRSQGGWLSLEMRLYRLHVALLTWIEDEEREEDAAKDVYTVSIMRLLKGIMDLKRISASTLNHVKTVFNALGFARYSGDLSQFAVVDESLENPLHFSFVKLFRKSGKSAHGFLAISEDPILWQLRLFGDFMDRSMDSRPDSRVQFEPDGWQRDVLDCLDANKSVLVVAPTSAGKTFISYYAMEQVLRQSDDGVLVYVAPTKALVNQIAAEIYGRFRKDLNGRSCWSIHTRDYRVNDPQKCQILVTVPEMLAIMLLSPPLARVWTPRIKRIILDEIHTIGQHEGGAVWEQILLLAPCPIIGLSATVGHPQDFDKWLHSVQNAHGFSHTFIHHPHRYSHLRKHVYLLPKETTDKFCGVAKYENSKRMRFLHPVTTLAFGTPSLPPDLSLEAQDTLSLYRAMIKCQVNADLSGLDPVNYFRDCGLLRQQDILRYEVALKDVLSKLISSPECTDPGSPLQAVIRTLQDPVLATITEEDLNVSPSPARFLGGLVGLLADLNSSGNLPALLFSFDRSYCEIMAQAVLKGLKDGEKKWREESPEWKRKVQAWEDWKIRTERQREAAQKSKMKRRDIEDLKVASDELSWESSFNPKDPSPQFSFAGLHKYPKEELLADLRVLQWRSNTQPWAYAALMRGIGVHHAGMNKRYRSLVETLFRQGYLRVVFCTGTLALGINAPTKTSVFVGDSPFLTSLMYRQCAGRAGRRGFDLLGHVVFYGLPMDRVQRLILSKLSRLNGNFPLTSTLCLRLFNLLHGSDNARVAVEAVQSILRLPQISFGSEIGREQLLHHFRFSIDYLRRAGLLDAQGTPMNLFAVAAHLYHTDPSNLALVALMRKGVIHDICNQTSLLQAKADFVLVMAHLFSRRYLPASYTREDNLKALRSKYPSQIVLAPLPQAARRALEEQNEEILQVFSAYVSLYTSQHLEVLGPDNQLPLSRLTVPIGLTTASQDSSLFHTDLRRRALKVITRSPFVANSGHSDHFASVDELTQTCRRGLNLNEHAIPSFEHIVSPPINSDGAMLLNAHIVDFYTHGQVSTLAEANGIRRGDVWYILEDFNLTLMSVRSAIEQLLLKASGEQKDNDEGGEEMDADSGFFSAQVDDEPEDDVPGLEFKRPARVSDRDWKVYEVVNAVYVEFNEKFKQMWA